MANGYPTGVSEQPLDFGSIAQSYMRSAVEQKLQDIKENKIQISKNAEDVLKAMSISAIPELSGKLREDFNAKIDKFRGDVVNRFRQSEGKLSLGDQMAIEKGVVDLTNEMNVKKNWLDKYAATQKILLSPSAQKTYNVGNATLELSKTYQDFLNGRSSEDPSLIPLKHVLPTDYTAILVKSVKDNQAGLGTDTNITITGGKKQTLSGIDPVKATDYLNTVVNSAPEFSGMNEQQKQAEVQKALPFILKQSEKTEPYIPKKTGSGKEPSYSGVVENNLLSMDNNRSDGVVLTEWKKPLSITVAYSGKEGITNQIADFKPKQIVKHADNKWYVEGVQTALKGTEVTFPASQAAAYSGMDIYPTGKKNDKGEDIMAVKITSTMDVPKYVPYEDVRKVIESKMPSLVGKFKSTQKQVPSYSREYLRSRGYSDKKIDEAVSSGKIKIQ